MVSITNVKNADQAKHYYSGKDNYYTKTEGQWYGKGAEALGLTGEVTKEDFENILNGQDRDGNQLVAAGGEDQKHRAAIDVCSSGPKSASILYEVCGDERVKEAHDKAVSAALDYVERNFSQCRQTTNHETERVNTGNMVVAVFGHNTSRELDCQTHTHAVVCNLTQREDGSWRAMANEEIYRQKMLIGQIYRNEFAKNLREIGYSVRSDNKGLFEIEGVPQELIEHFSRRSEQIDEKIKELKESGQYQNVSEQKLREIATLGSRVAKKNVDMEAVREAWQKRLQDQGYTREALLESAQKAGKQAHINEAERTEPRQTEYDYIRQAMSILNEQESNFTREDVLKTAGKLSVGEQRISDLDKAFNELHEDKEIVYLGQVRDARGGKTGWYTTQEMQKIERDIFRQVEAGHDKVEALTTKERTHEDLQAYEQKHNMTMTPGQKAAAEHIVTSKDRIIGVQGDAGTGKTTMLDAVRDIAEKEGYKVRGLAYTGKAASEIEQASGIKSHTVDSFLSDFNKRFDDEKKWQQINEQRHKDITQNYHEQMNKADSFDSARGRGNYKAAVRENTAIALEKLQDQSKEPELTKDKQIWIVDEASMLGSKKMYELQQAAQKADAKIVYVGDTKQLKAVEAGDMFSKLQESGAMRTAKMNESLRQQDADYKAVTQAMSERKIDQAMDKLEAKDKVYEIADRQERIKAIVEDYTSRKNPKDTIIVTARNQDRNELNAGIRKELKEQGKIAKDEHTFTVRESKNHNPVDKHFAQSYQEGDVIVANKPGLIGKAGAEAKVVSIDHQNHKITVEREKTVQYDHEERKEKVQQEIDLKKDGQHISAYREKEQSFSKGDKVVFTKNNRSLNVKNGQTGEIKSVDEYGNMTIKTDHGKNVSFNAKWEYQNVDHGYVVTDYKSQGQTSNKVIYHADTAKEVNYNQAYVAVTRGKQNLHVYTDSKEQLRDQMKHEQVKTSTLDYSHGRQPENSKSHESDGRGRER